MTSQITANINKAAAILRAGGLVAFPTETVYGLGADARNPAAIARVFAVKGRPTTHPLIVHLADIAELNQWASMVPPAALLLARHFWPGPLTIVLPKAPDVLPAVTGGQETVALRIPAHPIAQALLREFGDGCVAPSANLFTHVSPTTAQAVRDELGDQIEFILDGGPCAVGLESTIIDLSANVPVLLRPGMISQAQLEAVLGSAIHTRQHATTRAPGMHALHYAPRTQAILLPRELIREYLAAHAVPIAVLAFGETLAHCHYVTMPTAVADYAHCLYDVLRRVDHGEYQLILIEQVPETAEWDAVRDRLVKATALREKKSNV